MLKRLSFIIGLVVTLGLVFITPIMAQQKQYNTLGDLKAAYIKDFMAMLETQPQYWQDELTRRVVITAPVFMSDDCDLVCFRAIMKKIVDG